MSAADDDTPRAPRHNEESAVEVDSTSFDPGYLKQELTHGLSRALLVALQHAETHAAALRARAGLGLSEDPRPLTPDELNALASRYESLHSPEFRRNASRLVRVVESAIFLGEPDEVNAMALALARRDRRKWLAVFEAWFPRKAGRGVMGDHALRAVLSKIDARAAALTDEQISAAREAYSGPSTPISGLAARLACECDAFGYGQKDQNKARTAFAKLLEDDGDD